MIPYILPKTFSSDNFNSYLHKAQENNQFSNYGWAVQELETRARDLLEISEDKAIIATSSGTTALHALIWGIRRFHNKGNMRVGGQDFTFPSNSLGPAEGPIMADLSTNLMINVNDEYILNSADILILTNCFGHLYDMDHINNYFKEKIIIWDNAATPYSFWEGVNSCNFGTASYVSLHHTKPIGFGEGGLAIVDKKYEEHIRAACNFGYLEHKSFSEMSGNYKMSELSAAGILQWWDQFDIVDLQKRYVDNYYKLRYEMRDFEGDFWINYSEDEKFFPSCMPFIHASENNEQEILGRQVMKYYKPLRDFPISSEIYKRISCIAISEEQSE